MTEHLTKTALPTLRFPEFEGAGEWENKTIGEWCSVFSGGTPSTSEKDYYGGDIPFIRSAEIDKDRTELFLTLEGLKNSSAKLVNVGDVLVALYGANSGEVALCKQQGAINQAILCLRSRGSNAFVYHFLTHKKSWIIQKYLQGGQGNLSGEIIKSVALGVPELAEQQKIAAALSSLDDLIAAESEKLQALQTHKRGLMQGLFPAEGETVPRLRFAEFNQDWKLRQLSEFITERIEYPTEKLPLFSLTIEEGVTPKTERYERAFLVNNEAEAYKVVYPNDFAYNPMNLRFGAIAKYSGDIKVLLSKYYNIFNCDNSVDSEFCGFYFKSQPMISFYDNVATGSLIEKRRVHYSDFRLFKILFPEVKEQQKIAATLSSLDALLTAQSETLDALKLHKKGLMQGLFPT